MTNVISIKTGKKVESVEISPKGKDNYTNLMDAMGAVSKLFEQGYGVSQDDLVKGAELPPFDIMVAIVPKDQGNIKRVISTSMDIPELLYLMELIKRDMLDA